MANLKPSVFFHIHQYDCSTLSSVICYSGCCIQFLVFIPKGSVIVNNILLAISLHVELCGDFSTDEMSFKCVREITYIIQNL